MGTLPIFALEDQIKLWLSEDDLTRNHYYLKTLPTHSVKLYLHIKSNLLLAGVHYFIAPFVALGARAEDFEFLQNWDGKSFQKGEVIEFPQAIPFNIAISAERLALNLLSHGSAIATWTKKHSELAQTKNIQLLDTRKTTPGLKALEKYAVRVGGGFNHRLGQSDVWMIKDNHKTCLGGLKAAVEFFHGLGTPYQTLVAEIHDLDELKLGIQLGIKHVMLDNFNLDDLKQAIKLKTADMTFEISGGINLANLENYFMEGVDFISLGSLTYAAPKVDISLKFKPL